MRSGIYTHCPASSPNAHRGRLNLSSSSTTTTVALFAFLHFFVAPVAAVPGELLFDYSPAPPPDSTLSPPGAENAIRDKSYLPAQIGGLVGAYALSLVLVAAALLLLAKKRREHIDGVDALEAEPQLPTFQVPALQDGKVLAPPETPKLGAWVDPVSPYSEVSACAPGVDIHVDQRIVKNDYAMAQAQLEDMYKYVMAHEEAKENGGAPPAPALPAKSPAPSKREKNKPAGLSLHEKKESRASSILSALRSPRRKKEVKGMSISSPQALMTPMSATFPRHDEGEEMNSIPPRHYAPASPPPVPTSQNFGLQKNGPSPATPEQSPESTMSIDERLRGQLPSGEQKDQASNHSRNPSAAPSEQEQPVSAVSERSSSPLVGLPCSPKPGVNRFPSLPQSPKPGQTFSRPNAPSAVRTGGALPLRAYEPSVTSPSMSSFQTKQTVFERTNNPLSPGLRTPFTGTAVPYSPYQPQTPCIPLTPSLVTKADRKRMRKLEPKTPTLEMVKSEDEMW